MVPALILVLAAWCPITTTTTAPDRPQCPCPTTTTTTAPQEPSTTTTEPRLIILPPDPFPSTTTTTPEASTTTTTGPTIVDAATETRPARPRRLPETGPSGRALVAGGILVFLGGLFVAAGRRCVR